MSGAWAQTVPDAGTILRQQPQAPAVPKPAPAAPASEKPQAKPPAASQATIQVKGFRITGNTLVTEAELQERLKDLIGRTVRFDELLLVRLRLTEHYASKGYLVRVFLPEQQVRDGIVQVRVVEGTRGDINVESKGARVKADRVRRFLEARAPAGAPLDMNAVGEALNILNEQPGVQVTSALAAGKTESAVNMNVTAADKPLLSFDLAVNNQGARSTGTGQVTAGVAFANPTGLFDQASILVNRAEGSTFGRADYSLAVGDRGLRVGVTGTALSYHLVQPSFAALQARGTAQTGGFKLSYPLIRRDDLSFTLDGGIDTKQFVDRTVNGETGDRRVNVGNAGFSGYTVSSAPSGIMVVTFSGTLVAGSLDQRNGAALAADLAARRTQGNYRKVSYDVGFLRTFGRDWNLTGSFRGQQADKNLDSSERLTLGGANSVRAYPLGEATGDEGWILKADLKRRIVDKWRAGVFYDAGGITQNHTVPPAGVATPNRYTLAGAGLTLEWLPRQDMSLTFTLASPVGNNPGKSATGANFDGSRSSASRAWLGFVAKF